MEINIDHNSQKRGRVKYATEIYQRVNVGETLSCNDNNNRSYTYH